MKIVRFLMLYLVLVVFSGCIESSRSAPQELSDKYGDKVVLYATSWCGYCKKTRELFESNNIDYLEFDIERSSEGHSEFKKLGGRGIPLVLVNGRVVEGYSPNAVLKLINEKSKKIN